MPDALDDDVWAGESDQVFSSAAELFRLLATPIRLKIISALCQHEKNVSQLLSEIETTQPNMSQHLSTLYRAGVLSRRRDATQIYYRIGNERAATLCRAVCTQIALDMDEEGEPANGEPRLAASTPRTADGGLRPGAGDLADLGWPGSAADRSR